VAFDPKHLPEDPKTLQQIVLDLMAQLDRESSERIKIETLLRELLDSKRKRKKRTTVGRSVGAVCGGLGSAAGGCGSPTENRPAG
jgi:hypothetical protein